MLFNRFGGPSEADRNRTIATYDAIHPTANRRLNAEVSNLLVFGIMQCFKSTPPQIIKRPNAFLSAIS